MDNPVEAPEHCAEKERVACELAVPTDDDQVPGHLTRLEHVRQQIVSQGDGVIPHFGSYRPTSLQINE